MHDIICPNCGESFIASDVAFDLSEYVLPLLYSDPKDSEDVKSVGFKFYVDEDMIRKHTTPDNNVPLQCESSGGPGMAGPWFPFVITNKMLLEYISAELNTDGSLADLLKEIRTAQSNRNATLHIRHLEAIRAIYSRFFASARKGVANLAMDELMDDANVQTAVKILLYISSHQADTVTVKVRLYCAKLNPKKPEYRVPDVLFVLKNGIINERHYKCCRYCGSRFPDEFGYYKMMPVILMGSHYAGKTSYLLSLLYTVQELAPFVQDSIEAKTLENDDDLIAFSKNINLFKQGMDPNKTDFKDIPILNLLVNNVIYSFIDWPGEKFINSDARNDANFVYETRRVIMKARHFLCFLEPAQIDLNRVEAEERVRFAAHDLARSFEWHMNLPEGDGTVRSITYVINKIDLYNGDAHNGPNSNAQHMMETATSMNETDVYSNGRWNESEFKKIDAAAQGFLQVQNPNLLSRLKPVLKDRLKPIVPGSSDLPVSFVPVAPYGERRETGSNVVHRTRLAGIPLLRIMELDKKLIRKG